MNTSTLNGKVDEFIAVLQKNSAALAAAKVAVPDIIASLESKLGFVVTQGVEEEGLKTDLKTKVIDVAKATTALYDEFSSRIDGVAGTIGKKTPLGQQILQLRTDLLRRSRRHGTNEDTSSNPSIPNVA